MTVLALILAALALAVSLVVLRLVNRGLADARDGMDDALRILRGPQPSRKDREAYCRGAIAAAAGVELALTEHTGELQAALMLAYHRAIAAHARAELRGMGVEP